MAVVYHWAGEHTIIAEHSGEWRWVEFYQLYDTCVHMAFAVPHPVCVILDMTASGPLPPESIAHFLAMTYFQPPNIARVIVVDEDPHTCTLVEMIQRYRPQRPNGYQCAATLAEAQNLCN